MTQEFLVANLARMSTVHDRIKELREKAGLSMEQLAEKLGTAWQTIQQWENGKTAPQRKRLQSVAEALNTTVDYLVTGGYPPAPPNQTSRVEEPRSKYIADLEQHSGAVAVRKVIFKISAGIAGFAVEYLDNGDGEPIFQQQSWFDKRGIDPSKVYAAKVSGHSMEPKYVEGDVVFIDTGDTKREKSAAFAFNHEGEFTIKRLRYEMRRWYLVSDNPDQKKYPPALCGDGTYILGRIVLHVSETL